MHRSFHWKRLVVVLLVLGVVSGGLYAVNYVQVRRQASIIKSVAEKAEAGIDDDAEKRAEAISLYNKYLKFNPHDEDVAVKYARLLLDQYKAEPNGGTASAAASGVELVLRQFPDHPQERKDLIDLYIKSGKLKHAHEHIEVLFTAPKGDCKNDVELLEMAALCEQLLGQNEIAIERLEQAIQTGNVPVRIYQQVLQLLSYDKGERSPSKIADYVRALKEKEPWKNNLEARIAVARFELFRKQYESARQDIDYARQRLGGETNADTLHAAAELEIAAIRTYGDIKPHLAAARDVLAKAFKLDPHNVGVGLFYADILDKHGDRVRAIEVLRETAKAYGPINDQYWVLIDYLIDLRNQDLSSQLVDRAEANSKTDPRVGYYRGRLAVLNSDWMQAKSLLEEAAPNLVKLPAHHKRAMFGLGIVYGVLQNPDQQLACFRSAVRDDPGYTLALIGEAQSLEKLGRYDEAISRYQALVTTFQIVDLRPTLVRLRLLDMLRKPPENRNWNKFDSEDNLGLAKERSSEVSILYAHSLAARGQRDNAIKVLKEVLVKDQKNVFAWVALARIQEAGKPEAALHILDEAIKTVGDTVELRLARADVLVFLARQPHASDFEILGVDTDTFSKPDQYRLFFGLGQAAINAMYRVTDPEPRRTLQDVAIAFLRRAGKADPLDLHCRAVLVDLGLTSDRKDVLEAAIDELARLEGPTGPISTLARVSIRLNDVKKLANAEAQLALIRELREETRKVQQLRQGWGRVYVALGRLDELEGLTDQAVEHYRQAINEGDRDEAVIRKTVTLYRERKMDAQAAGMLDELATKMVLPEDLERYRTIFELLNRTIPRTERPTIDRIAPETSKDSRILLLRGSLLAAIREDGEALKAFRLAMNIADDNPDTWDALVRQFVRMGDLASAKGALKEAEKKLLDPPAKSALSRAETLMILGGCSEICGDLKTADGRYHEALKTAPKEISTNRRIVDFYLRTGRARDADQLLETLAEAPDQDLARWARRYLAGFALMTQSEAYGNRGKALALINKNLALAPNDPQDIKARAVILTVDPATREEGMQILKDYWAKGDLTPDESYHLGLLIFSQGPSKIPESVKFFESAARPRPGVTVEHIAGLIRVYLALDKLDYAEPLLERLRTAVPNTWDVAREEARILMKKSQAATARGDRDDARKFSDQARTLIKSFPGSTTPDAIRQRTGPLLAELGFNDDATVLYRTLLDKPDSPTAHVPLAILYIQTKKSEDAIKLAREFERTSPVLLTAQLLSGAVRVQRPTRNSEDYVERWLNDKIRQYEGKPEHAGLLAARAELLHAQNKYDESIAEYRRALQEGPNDFAANNVAMLIALYSPKDVDEAIRLITRVIDLRGPIPTYLDTRAVAYIVKGGDAIEKAVEDLKMARLQSARAVYVYHLAWAYELQQKRPERDKMLEEAKRMGLDIRDLHPLELDIYRKLYGPDAK